MSNPTLEQKQSDLDRSAATSGIVRFMAQYLRTLRFYLVTGLMVWIPMIVTIWLTWWLFKNVGLGIENLIESVYARLNTLGERVPWLAVLAQFEYQRGLGFLSALALFLTTGFFARYLVGRKIIGIAENLFQRIPGIRPIYKAVQQIRDVFVNRGGAVVQRVVLIEYPQPGVYAVAFQTSSHSASIETAVGKNVLAVFMPTTPNPTSGFLMYVQPQDVIPLDVSVEDAMKLIISGGAYDPHHGMPPEIYPGDTMPLPKAQ